MKFIVDNLSTISQQEVTIWVAANGLLVAIYWRLSYWRTKSFV